MTGPTVTIGVQVRKWAVDEATDVAPERDPDEVYVGDVVTMPIGELGVLSDSGQPRVVQVTATPASMSAWLEANRETGDPVIVAEITAILNAQLAAMRQREGDN